MGNFNPNYFERKAGSLERAVLDAVNGVKTQINEDSMNVELANDKMLMRNIEKMGVKIKILNRFGKNPDVQLIGKKDKINKVVDKYQTNMSSDNNFAFNEKKMDAVGKEDGDIDNDGDKDSSDKYLAKRRKAIGKAMKKEETIFEATGKDIAKKMMGSKTMKSFASKVAKMKSVTKGDLEKMLPDYVAGADISKLFEAQDGGDFKPHMMYDPKTGKGYEAKTMEDHLRMKKMGYDHNKPKMENFIGTPENTNAKLDATPGQSSDEWNQQVGLMQKKNMSMREALAKVWGFDEGKNPFKKEEKVPKGFHRMPDGSLMKDSDMDKKENKTMTGKPATKVSVDPDMKEKRN
jgi:hypothetical protein